MSKVVCLLLLVAAVHCQDLDPSLLSSIFGNPQDFTSSTTTTSTTAAPLDDRNNVALPNINLGDFENATCALDDGGQGVCVPFYLCNKNGSVNSDGEDLIDIRVGEDEAPCGSYLGACCAAGDRRPPTDPVKPTTPPVVRQGCGWRNPNGADMRTTGEGEGESKFGEFPWMVALIDIEKNSASQNGVEKLNVYVGGGSLIHPSAVLTAAHYVATRKSLKIRAGEWDTQRNAEIYPFQDRDVATVTVHKDFNKGNLFYDVALLFLAQPVDLAPHVGVACLPPPRQRTPAGTRCFATGWGKDTFGKTGRYQVILKKIEVPVVGRPDCQAALRRTRLGKFFELHSSFMCAGGEKGKDACKGDGGSPLSCPIQNEPDRYMQSGIVAWGIGCGEDGTPGVYVDVSIMRDWIDDKMAGKGLDIDSYKFQ